jgi:hypothetical protein
MAGSLNASDGLTQCGVVAPVGVDARLLEAQSRLPCPQVRQQLLEPARVLGPRVKVEALVAREAHPVGQRE